MFEDSIKILDTYSIMAETTLYRKLTHPPSLLIENSRRELIRGEDPIRFNRRRLTRNSSEVPNQIKVNQEVERVFSPFNLSPEAYDFELPACSYPRERSNYLHPSQLITEMIASKHGEKVHIADIGYGAGFALLEVAIRWKDTTSLTGIGFSEYAKETYPRKTQEAITSEEGSSAYDLLQKYGVKLIEGSVTDLVRYDAPKFDLIMACHSLPYVSWFPQWEIIKKLYHSLNKNGILLLTGFGEYYDPQSRSIISDPDVLAGSHVREDWKRYFGALEGIGCFVGVKEFGYPIKIVMYRESDKRIPNIINGVRRPPDRFFISTKLPDTLSGSGASRIPSLAQKATIAYQKWKQR